ncbi:MAG: 3,4-dihydroxy-2-butanone-4-phosphate synthase, partial [Candidatus Korarchaeota archaeon]|nr:3,4-dihydroxy-2-butanone-4-phosphate synthase [Candidatus Korarchaeota archaeon]
MLEEAYKALRQGRAVMIYDASDREGEVDLVYHASLITPE